MQYIGIGKRVCALTIDGVILVLIYMIILFSFTGEPFLSSSNGNVMRILSATYSIILPVIIGGTLGKRILNIRIADAKGENISIIASVKRYLPFLIIMLIVNLDGSRSEILYVINKWLPMTFYIIECVMISISPYRQSLHDRFAGTYVIAHK